MPRKTKTLDERFWDKVSIPANVISDCWEWTASKKWNGYGQITISRGHVESAHRLAYQLVHGPIPPGNVVMHSCDNRGCVNPSHLTADTQAANLDDMRVKGRGCIPVGEHNGRHKLNSEQVRSIREAYAAGGISQRELGERYGVRKQSVYAICKGKVWRSA